MRTLPVLLAALSACTTHALGDRSPPAELQLELPLAVERAAESVDPSLLRDVVAGIASDKHAGRLPGSTGDGEARAWLARNLAELGYAPAAPDGSWEQPFDIVGVDTRAPAEWVFTSKKEKLRVARGDEYIAVNGAQTKRVDTGEAEIVFVGYGIEAPEEQWDDYKGVDVRGTLLLMLNDDPDWDPELFAGERRLYYGRWTYKYEIAARKGALGAIIIHTDESAGYPWTVVQSSWSGEQFELPAAGEPLCPVKAWVTEAAARRLMALGGHDLDEMRARARARPFVPLPLGVTTSLSLDSAVRRTETANVLGILEGTDLKNEVVIFSAHHDHFGVGEPDETGDTIYNGARDNGAAIAQAFAVARVFTALPTRPRRSILFAFVGAEEQGLLGSAHFAKNPTFPPSQMAANINFELGNIWGRTRDVVIHGKNKNTLDALITAAAKRQGRSVRDEANPKAGWYYRSDQFSFAKIGVPAVWFESGRDYIDRPAGWGDEQVDGWIVQHYHRPSDELTEDWIFDGMVEDAQLAFAVGYSLAMSDALPEWLEGDEFAGRR